MLDRIRIVLVNTSHPGNIGGAARAMKNMGLSRLYLVAPKDYPHERAVWRASNALDVLDNAVVCETLEEAIGDCQLVVGTSARDRSLPWPLLNPRQFAAKVAEEPEEHQVAVVFGREDRGMTNEELQRCHFHVQIPTNPEYSSLNLAAAVQVLCYELRMAAIAPDPEDALPWGVKWDEPIASAADTQRLFEHLESVLIDIDFLDPENPRQLMPRLKRLFTRSRMDKVEMSMMRGVLTSVQQAIQPATQSGKATSDDD